MVYIAVAVGAGEAGSKVLATLLREGRERLLAFHSIASNTNPKDYDDMPENLKKALPRENFGQVKFWLDLPDRKSLRVNEDIQRDQRAEIDRDSLRELYRKFQVGIDKWRFGDRGHRGWGGGAPIILLISSAGGRSGSQISLDLSKEIKEENRDALIWQILILPGGSEKLEAIPAIVSTYNLLRFISRVFGRHKTIDLLSLIDNEALIDNIIRKPSLRLYRPGMSGDALYDAINTAIFYMLEPLLTLSEHTNIEVGGFRAGLGGGIGLFSYVRGSITRASEETLAGNILAFMRSLGESRNLSVVTNAREIREAAEGGTAYCFPVIRGPEGMLPDSGVEDGIRELVGIFGQVAEHGSYPLKGARMHEASMHVSNLTVPPPSVQELIRYGIECVKNAERFSSLRPDLAATIDSLGEDRLREIIGGGEEGEQLVEVMKGWMRR